MRFSSSIIGKEKILRNLVGFQLRRFNILEEVRDKCVDPRKHEA